MVPRLGHPAFRYGIPFVSVGLAVAFTALFSNIFQHSRALLFIFAVVISALYGGLGPGLLASGLAALASAFFFLPPPYSLDIVGDDVLQIVVFTVVALIVSWLSGTLRKSEEALRQARNELEQRVHERTAALTSANQELTVQQNRLQFLAAELSTAEERERRRIATVLHDAIGHALAVAVMKLRGEMERTSGNQQASDLIEQAIQHTRSLTLQLSPPILYELGLCPAVESLAEQIEKQHGFRVRTECRLEADTMDEEVRSLLFSAVRELLVNIIKHAKASNVAILIEGNSTRVRVQVKDDGIGFDPRTLRVSSTSGFGLFNIRQRLDHIGGAFALESSVGQGCTVQLEAPLEISGRSIRQMKDALGIRDE